MTESKSRKYECFDTLIYVRYNKNKLKSIDSLVYVNVILFVKGGRYEI